LHGKSTAGKYFPNNTQNITIFRREDEKFVPQGSKRGKGFFETKNREDLGWRVMSNKIRKILMIRLILLTSSAEFV